MKSVDNTLVEVQDGLCNLKMQMGSLKDMAFVLQSGFEKINDDNSNFIISCLQVLEAQLSYMNEEVLVIVNKKFPKMAEKIPHFIYLGKGTAIDAFPSFYLSF